MIEVEYNGRTYRVPLREDVVSLKDGFDDSIPGDEFEGYAMAYLMQDGNLAVPGGEYGRDTESCAEVAIALNKIMIDSGSDTGWYALDSDMGTVVNGHDDVAYLIVRDGERLGIDPRDLLDDDQIAAATEQIENESF